MNEISLQELRRWESAGQEYQLIDVRDPEEHTSHNIGGQLIPLADILKFTDQLSDDRPVVVYCKRGIRSQLAIQRWQRRRPDVDFVNLRGGIGIR